MYKNQGEYQAMIRRVYKAAADRRAQAIAKGCAYTSTPFPPGDGAEWNSAIDDHAEMMRERLCEFWRMDFGEETRFANPVEFPPSFNLSGLWWRRA